MQTPYNFANPQDYGRTVLREFPEARENGIRVRRCLIRWGERIILLEAKTRKRGARASWALTASSLDGQYPRMAAKMPYYTRYSGMRDLVRQADADGLLSETLER